MPLRTQFNMTISQSLWQIFLASASAYITVTVVGALTNPLRNIPGPWYSLWTDLILKYHVIRGRKAQYVQELHERYGPVVRMSPEQADICSSLSALKEIGRADFRKTDYYKSMTVDEDNVFNTGDPSAHRRMRRLLSGGLSESSLKCVKEVVDGKVKLWVERMRGEMKERKGTVDVFKWAGFMATDVIAELTFGESFGMLEEGRKHQYFRDMESAAPVLAIRALFPFIRQLMAMGVPIPGSKKAMDMISKLRGGAEDRLARHRQHVEEASAKGETPSPTLFDKLHDATGGEKGLTAEEILSNAQLYIVAGSDTSSNALTYVIWNICKRPEVKRRLLDELRGLPGTEVIKRANGYGGTEEEEVEVDYEDLRPPQSTAEGVDEKEGGHGGGRAPYLNAIIDETLRLYPSTPAPLPRYVPPGGMELAGHWFDAGSVVSTQAWSYHMDPIIFPEPKEFNPDRWLPGHVTKEMKEGFVPFGHGVRICLGMHLAMMEIRLATARFFLSFPDAEVSTAEGMSDADMEQVAFFMAFPKGKRCLIQGF